MEPGKLPVGFGMMLAQNEPAMKAFEALSETDKEAILHRTHQVSSKREMRDLVASLTAGGGLNG